MPGGVYSLGGGLRKCLYFSSLWRNLRSLPLNRGFRFRVHGSKVKTAGYSMLDARCSIIAVPNPEPRTLNRSTEITVPAPPKWLSAPPEWHLLFPCPAQFAWWLKRSGFPGSVPPDRSIAPVFPKKAEQNRVR